jgi:choline/glycine/proline betaine transport protein
MKGTDVSSRTSTVATRVFVPAAAVILAVVAITLLFPQQFSDFITEGNQVVIDSIGWYYVLIVTGFVFFALWLAFSRLGDVTLGKDGEEPQYGLGSWFAMLFAAGMGIGLVFYGAAEPLIHFAGPPPGVEGSDQAVAQAAMNRTFLHWGVHAWAIYVVVGLAVAYAVHRRGRPVSIRWALEPLIGRRLAQSWLGDLIDIAAIVGTVFGVATSLGLGVSQIGSGLEFLGWVSVSETLLVVLIVAITAAATTSVVTGLDKGIKYLSNTNMVLAVVLVLAVLVLGPTLFLAREFVQNLGSYLQNFLGLSFTTLPFYGEDGTTWLGGWTTYYWGWWISWSPFVGIFIARISRGRTVREFVIGVLLVPTLVTFLWFSVLGGSALYREMFGGGGLVGADGQVDQTAALFQLLDGFPGGTVLAGLAVILVIIFFVTSSDSASFVVDMISHGGDPNPPVWSRVFWALLEGAIAAVVLGMVGAELGLTALQIMAILVAVPFSVVMILMAVALAIGLRREHRRTLALERQVLQRELLAELQEAATNGAPDTAGPVLVGDRGRRRWGRNRSRSRPQEEPR